MGLRAEKVAESEVGIFQLRLGVKKFRLLVSQSHFGALYVQITNNAGAKALLLTLEFLLEDSHGILPHTHLRPIQEKFVKRHPHIHYHSTGDLLQLIVLLLDIEPCDGHLAGYCSTSVQILFE